MKTPNERKYDIETIDIVNTQQLYKLLNKYKDNYNFLVNTPKSKLVGNRYKDIDNYTGFKIDDVDLDFRLRRLNSSTTKLVAKINHYDKTIMIYKVKLTMPTFESYNRKRKMNEEYSNTPDIETIEKTILNVVKKSVMDFNKENNETYKYNSFVAHSKNKYIELYKLTKARGAYYERRVGTLEFYKDKEGLVFVTSRGGVWDGDVKEYVNYEDVENKVNNFVNKCLNIDMYR